MTRPSPGLEAYPWSEVGLGYARNYLLPVVEDILEQMTASRDPGRD